jgi:uncharacterized LabA/DUF88 family protein
MSENVLVLVDVQNVFYGSKSYSNNQQQVDYEKLLEVINEEVVDYFDNAITEESKLFSYHGLSDLMSGVVAHRTEIHMEVRGYVVRTPKYRGTALFAFLRKIGYSLCVRYFPDDHREDDEWKGTVSNIMQMDLIQECVNYDAVVVVSGNGVFEPAFKAMEHNWSHVHRIICAFKDTLHETYTRRDDLVDHIIHLDDRVLRNSK